MQSYLRIYCIEIEKKNCKAKERGKLNRKELLKGRRDGAEDPRTCACVFAFGILDS